MKKISIILFASSLIFSGCKKGFLDINSTPNNPTSVPPSVILPNTTIAIAFANGNDLNRAASVLVQHTAGIANQVQAYDIFNLDGSFDNQWNFEIYNGALNNLEVLISATALASPAYSGIAKLQKAYVLSLATDLWGDVPYSQAGKGLVFETPRFDKQEDIYQGNSALQITSLIDLVKDGIADLGKTSALKPGTKDDLVYKGVLPSWIRAGNTLLLKFAIQIANRNPALAKSTIQAVITGNNYINANTLDLEVPFGSAVGNRNPIFDFNNNLRTGDMMLSARLLTLSRSLNDTVRLAKFFTKPNGVFTGFNNGSTAAAPALASRSKYNTYLTGAVGGEAPIRLLTFAQVNFILAEAALTLQTTGDPNTYYQAGITASMQKVGMTAAEITTYFTTNPTVVNLAGTNAQKLEQIITQKYISWIGNGIEAYNDYRRTGYPLLALPLNTQGDNPNVIPTRLPYTSAELARNPNAPRPRPKTDVKLWWAL
ncbi:MAG: SusD/RagB family nutrient-binding outer membrane lipoprotein [Ferruginibacter sp.]